MYLHADKVNVEKSKSQPHSTNNGQRRVNLHARFLDNRPEAVVQKKIQETANKRVIEQQPIQKKENKTGLPDILKFGIENLSGYSMDDVKVHYNSPKPAQLQAHAFAQGTAIHLASGQEKYLPHEAWHVVQQKQGRVQPTFKMNGGVNINDNVDLEKEADLMGQKAMGIHIKKMPTQLKHQKNSKDQIKKSADVHLMYSKHFSKTIQRTIKPVTEEVIIASKRENPELEEDYFDGLYYGADGKTYVYAGQVAQSFLIRGGGVKPVKIFIPSNQMTEDSVQVFLESNDLSKINFVSKDEKIRVNGEQLKNLANESGIVRDGLPPDVTYGDSVFQKLFDRALDGEPIGGAGGEFGNVEFRFRATEGTLFTTVPEEEISDAAILAKWKAGVEVERLSLGRLIFYQDIYRTLGMPYIEERIGRDFLFVSKDNVEDVKMYDSVEEAGEYPPQSHFDILKRPNENDPPIPAPPGGKNKKKTYVRTAIRGDRGTGQKAAMGNTSAKDYAYFFTGNRAHFIDNWEWLHLQGSRLGGKNERNNLVAGTASANSAMIPMEREILALSRDSDARHPVNVEWIATLKRVGNHLTHIGDRIRIVISVPNGTKSNPAARNIDKSFDATEGTNFTKFDRDFAHLRAKKQGGRN